MENVRQFFSKLAIKQGIQRPEEWYKMTLASFKDDGGSGIIKRFGSLDRGTLIDDLYLTI
jgi:hypothetical protein